ncbi:amidohydrolase [Achromobacter denitrificans]|uniref:Amidohydrolase n=1 Tax=Achromobacter denitrificans TaxID=32002 RepID=A0A6J5CTY3_ACHDE|nr:MULTISPECIES: amidohydrolase [Achromobacter]ASC66828.1 amidohydrolase [Achromobacter denitrificans]MBV2159446.1 amidohydrolase [Achromobacter denitrificans]MDF3847981.1 amidohydrolase [Achromobacter denitrificans]MDF3938789.1 amidohydrolase [Achromobacter denitrificans]MDX3880525.1 amidohydrolase [Achromobacter sp.]
MPRPNTLFRLAPLALAAHLLMSGPAAAQSAPGTQGPLAPAPDPALAAQIDQRARAIEDKLIAWRRDIHQHPELGNQETRTAKLVADHLRALGMDVKTGVAGTGVVAVLKGGKPGPVVALRADMDALPVKEQVDVPYASKAKGTYLGKEVDVMHACGHDAHTAILMATAEVLAGMKDELPGSVKFIFQPAEESPADFEPDGKKIWGAKMMVQEGVLEQPKVDAIFGLHVSSAYPAGKLSWRSGPAMAAADQFWIDVTGKQTHGARPWSGIDPIVVSSQIILGLQTIPSRQINSMLEPAVITVGAIHGGNRMNIVPDSVAMTGTIRTYDEGMKKDIHQRIARTADMIAQSAGAKADVRVVELYNATVNHPELTEKMGPTLRRVAGDGNYGLQPKSTASEDFSFYQEKVPGMFFYLGVTPKDTDVEKAAPNHSPRFYVDESGLINGVRALSNLAVDYMAGARQGG